MRFHARDLQKLRWQIAGATGLIILGGLVTYFSQNSVRKIEAEYRAATARHAQIESKLRRVRTEEEEIKNRASLFLQLQELGFLGKEKRLDWTEMLRGLQQRLRLPGMAYEFSPSKALPGTGDSLLYVSSMKLRLQLVHEEDLLNFLSRMQQEAKAMVLVRSCNVTRISGDSRSLAQLAAECEIDWITAQIKGSGGPQ